MAKRATNKGYTKAVHAARPDWNYYLPKEDKSVIKKLAKKPIFPKICDRPCTKIMTLFPEDSVNGHSGKGYHMINIDGYRTINAYVISDALNSTTQRGFTLELSFSVNDFVYGVGVIGETSHFFNFDNYFDPGNSSHRTIRIESNDLTTTGGLPWIGGTDLTHILRVPVLGPYVRASVFNEDDSARRVEVKAYLST
ncbi:MAG: hypothetical protein KZQ93_10325 [Candidatus Thiodiazotropha sp. (ex Monitilora ramsayi)]|nr:hypothetical protein [Candidatus Thiodiazotropha sp. (ex Monitilora ramsayi)]